MASSKETPKNTTAAETDEKLTETAEKPVETSAQKQKVQNESVYSVKELAGNAGAIFGTRQECVVAALKLDGKTEYTVSEAQEIVEKFLKKEVK